MFVPVRYQPVVEVTTRLSDRLMTDPVADSSRSWNLMVRCAWDERTSPPTRTSVPASGIGPDGLDTMPMVFAPADDLGTTCPAVVPFSKTTRFNVAEDVGVQPNVLAAKVGLATTTTAACEGAATAEKLTTVNATDRANERA
jgi:hypothetical protein